MKGTPLHSVSVAGVAVDEEGRVLLIKRRDNGHWQAPGGVLELGESFEQGVRREVQEETGIEVKVGDLTGVYKNICAGVVALVYKCQPIGGELTATEESSDVAWLHPEEAVSRMRPTFAVRVEDALRGHRPASRTHNGTELL